MKNVLVIGSTGQIGSELTMKIRNMYPEGNVVAGYIKGAEPKGVLLESGPAEEADVCNGEQLLGIVKKYNIDTIYNLAALLSAVAERKPQLAWHIQIDGLMNLLLSFPFLTSEQEAFLQDRCQATPDRPIFPVQ